jgi:hypothetical protein
VLKNIPMPTAAAICVALAISAEAKFAAPQPVPVERLVNAAQTWRDAHPDDAGAHYTLARIHYLAFSRGTAEVPALGAPSDNAMPEIPGNWQTDFDLYEARQRHALELALKDLGEPGPRVPPEKASALEEARGRRARQLEEQNWRPRGELSAEEMFAHATAALAGFREAARIDPKNGLYPLGLASLAEEFADWAKPRRDVPAALRSLDHASARTAYLRAYRLAIVSNAALPSLPPEGFASLVSYEAGNAYVRLTERERRKLPPAEKAALAEVKDGLAKLKRIRLGAITPIVFAMKPSTGVARLLAPALHVDFDLRGYGPRERWPWIRPTTGFLVWDPDACGAITSARQLFGSYTFEIFRRTGYDALAALDDDGDGALRGDELRGIRAWFDANSDGRSEPDEVRDLCDLGITAIATRSTARDGPHPTNPRGLTLRDGGTLPTWDWIAEPAHDYSAAVGR